MIKAVIFDLDNTLVDFMGMKHNAVKAAILAMIDAGLPLKQDEALEKINSIYDEHGIEYQKVFDVFLKDVCKEIPQAMLAAGIVAYRRSREAALVPYPHVYQTLIHLFRKGFKLGVVSDAPRKEAWLRIAYLNLHHIFEAVVTYEDTGEYKPSEKPFKKVLEMLKVKPSEAIMIGDWPERDIVGARNLGMKTAFAKYGNTFEESKVDADYVINDISELLKIVAEYNK
jgi:HAD superfamily hydrolase (TIGR02253 family)